MSTKTKSTKEPIYDFRVEAGLPLKEAADKFPVSTRTLIRWEQGETRIPVKWLAKAESVYGKTRAEIRPDIFGATQ